MALTSDMVQLLDAGVAHQVAVTREMERPGYVANAGDRCYHCRTELFKVLGEIAVARGFPALAYGAIADDASAPHWNPGGLGLIARAQFQATRTSNGLVMNEEYLGLALPNWRWGPL